MRQTAAPAEICPSPQPRPAGVRVVEVLASYQGRRQPVLRAVSMDLAPGERIAITGPAASGKSSLAKLLVGVLPPVAGHVTVDDLSVTLAGSTGRIGYVPQVPSFPKGTIADLLHGFDPDASSGQQRWLRELGLVDIIARLPHQTPQSCRPMPRNSLCHS